MYCDPASECAIAPRTNYCRRENAAMFNASVTRSAVIVAAVRQPTIIRECTSVTNAVYVNPDHVGT